MEEYNYKISQNNSILTLNAVSSLVSKIKLLHNSSDKNEFNKHYKYLREQCISPKHSVATSAVLGLIELTNGSEEILSLDMVIKDLMSGIANVENVSGLIDLIFHALFKYNMISNYDIMKNQHPLISILKRNQQCWPHILCCIEDKFRSESRNLVLERLQPFALYVLYDYEKKMDQVLQIEMINIYKQYLDKVTHQKIILLNPGHISRSLRYCKTIIPEVCQMLTYVISAIYVLLQHDQDASEAIWILHQQLSQNPDRNYSLEIVMVSDCIPLVPVASLGTLCDCLEIMLSMENYPKLITNTVNSSLLAWKMHFATTDIPNEKLSSQIDKFFRTSYEDNEINLIEFEYLDEKQFIYSHILANNFSEEFLEKLKDKPPHIMELMFNMLLGYFYGNNDQEHTVIALDLCLKCCESQPRYSTQFLPVLLNKLSVCTNPDLHMHLLKALPKMGVLKENLSTVVMTIKAVSSVSTIMHAIAVSLMYDLVLIDKKCFPYLLELLTKEPSHPDSELVIAKAFVVQELCRGLSVNGFENYRKELATYISKVLISTKDNSLAITFAFEGLKHLCVGFDLFLTMANLTKRFENDTRERVIIGMCDIIGEMAISEDLSDAKAEELIKLLFSYTEKYIDAKVLKAVFRTIGKFSMEQLALNFPVKYSDITNDTTILGSLAGMCWVNLLQHGPRVAIHYIADMLIQFIHNDMKAFKRGTYEISEGHGEPLYMSLPRDNVLAAVAKFVKKNTPNLPSVDKEVYLQALRILSVKYKRPFPPMDWSFLSELKDKDMQEYCITIASKQSGVSASARKFCENRIKLHTEKKILNEEVLNFYSNLDVVCNTIQPVIMKPFFKKTLKLGFSNLETYHKEVHFMLGQLEEVFKSPNMAESNKTSAAEVLISIFDKQAVNSEGFNMILAVLGKMPMPHLHEYFPVNFDSLNDKLLSRCLSVHCSIALADEKKPFSTLDNLIDCRILKSCLLTSFEFDEMLLKLTPVFQKHRNHPSFPAWLNELSAKISIELAEKKDMRNVIFTTRVFVIAVTVTSGYIMFTKNSTLEDVCNVFPFAISHLLSTKAFASHVSQIIESMYDFATNQNYKRNVISEQFAKSFKHAILAMRTHENFNEKFRWMKYIEVNF